MLPGIDVPPWLLRDKADPAANELADRHYSRQTPGSGQVGPPGFKCVLVTPCERALWLTHYTLKPDDGLDAFRCSIFRNEGAGLSSELIRAAMETTERILTRRPPDGWVTWVDERRVESPNPGYCFKCAGWWVDREWSPARGRRGRVRLRASLIAPERKRRGVISTPTTFVSSKAVHDTPALCGLLPVSSSESRGGRGDVDERAARYAGSRTA